MTLIVGIRCRDGVVVGADSAATYNIPLGMNTVEQPAQKLEIKNDCVIIGISGRVGLGQLVSEKLSERWQEILQNQVPGDARSAISQTITEVVSPHLQRGLAFVNLIGQQNVFNGINLTTLVAIPVNNHPVLVTFDFQAQSEEATEGLPFVAIGGGQHLADPFLAFLRRVLWNDECPNTIGEGVFATLWTLDHVIRVNAGGVGGKPVIAVLKNSDTSSWKAEFLAQDRLQEHLQAIEGAEKALSDYANNFKTLPSQPALKLSET